MRTIALGKSDLQVPVVAVGCFRMHRLDRNSAEIFVRNALEQGANFFDHADMYGGGTCEEIFSDAVQRIGISRDKLILQSKCGIIPEKMFDFSKKHILEAVDGSLKRLKTDYLDVLLLHRPDALVEPDEVAEAFDLLQISGKVRHFGVSNHNPSQIQLLQKSLKQPLVANQLQFSIMHAMMVSEGINVNMTNESAVNRDGGVLNFCRIHDITIQPWSPFQYGFFEGVFLDNPKFPELNAKVNEIAGKYGVKNTTIAIAWILRHPAHMQPITGTMNVERLLDCIKASEINLTREEWYDIYRAAGNVLP